MPLHEGAASRVLPSESNRSSFHEEGTKRQNLGVTPVNATFTHHFVALIKQLPQLCVHGESGRWVDVGITNAVKD